MNPVRTQYLPGKAKCSVALRINVGGPIVSIITSTFATVLGAVSKKFVYTIELRVGDDFDISDMISTSSCGYTAIPAASNASRCTSNYPVPSRISTLSVGF